MVRSRTADVLAWGLALLAPLAALQVTYLVNDALGAGVGFLIIWAAVIPAAYLGGILPGATATLVGAFLYFVLYVPPGPAPTDEVLRVRVALFTLDGLLLSWFADHARRGLRTAEQAKSDAEAQRAAAESAISGLAELQALTADLSRARTTPQVATAVLERGRRELGADAGAVAILGKDGRALETVDAIGYDAVDVDRWRRIPMDTPIPATEVVRTGRPIFIGSPGAVRARFPHGPVEEASAASVATLPLEIGGLVIGVLGWRWATAQAFDSPQREALTTLAALTGQALERTRLYESELLAREMSESGRRRTSELAGEVSRLAIREREHARSLESVIAAIGEGIVVVGPDGSVGTMNAAAEGLLGGRVATEAELADRLGTNAPLLDGHGGVMSEEYQLQGDDTRWLELTGYPIGDGSAEGADGATHGTGRSTVLVIRDVTAFRQGQGLREAFLSLLSHELRTPVTTIYAGATVLGRPPGSMSDAVRREILSDVGAEADRLYRLVEDLLVLARFDEGIALGLEPHLLQRIVPRVVDHEQARWPGIRFEVQLEPNLPAVAGDETAIIQVVRNLCSNAAKYSSIGSTVEVRIESAEDGVTVRVLDAGPGVKVDEAEHLFDPFYRSPATAAMASGAGIGLYVCRRLVVAMSGRIWGRPRDGGGSEFGLTLPAYEMTSEDEPTLDETIVVSGVPPATPAHRTG
jgi:K+-sensing histidine kinase KdpD